MSELNEEEKERVERRQSWNRRSFVFAVARHFRTWLYPVFPMYPDHIARLSRSGEPVYCWDYAKVQWADWLYERWVRTQETFSDGIRLANSRGYKLVFVFVPIKFRVFDDFVEFTDGEIENSWTTWPVDNLFDGFCESRSVTCLQLTPILKDSLRNGGMPHAAVDSHWSKDGTDLVARSLASIIESKGWLKD